MEGLEIYTVELYLKVRLACADGMSKRAAARHFNISRDTVDKAMAFSIPPGYRRTAPVKRPKLDGFIEIIDSWLDGDKDDHRKQHHTAKRVFDRLRVEHGFTGGYPIIKDYVRERERRGREMFVPLAHPPGHAQADFGEAIAIIGGVEQQAHFFVMDLPHSDACFVRAYPAAKAEAWMDGHVHAFAFFGGVPLSVLYDNDRCLVSKILPDGTRKRATLFSALQSHGALQGRKQPQAGQGAPRLRRCMAEKAGRRARSALRSFGNCGSLNATLRVLALPPDTSSKRSEVPIIRLV